MWRNFLCFIKLISTCAIVVFFYWFVVLLLSLRRKSFLICCSEVILVERSALLYVRHSDALVGNLSEVESCWIHSIGIIEELFSGWVFSYIFPTSWLPSARNQSNILIIFFLSMGIHGVVIVSDSIVEWLGLRHI